MEDFVYILVFCEAQVSDRAWVLKYQLEWDKVQWLQTHCGQTWISLGRLLHKDILLLCPRWCSGPYAVYIQERPYMNTFCECIFKKIGLTHAHFLYNSRKLINVVKVHFTMMYSSRRLNNTKVITTACNFWRQISCSFQVMSGNILFWGKKIFEIPPFFQTRPGDLGKKVHACSLRFSALKFDPG